MSDYITWLLSANIISQHQGWVQNVIATNPNPLAPINMGLVMIRWGSWLRTTTWLDLQPYHCDKKHCPCDFPLPLSSILLSNYIQIQGKTFVTCLFLERYICILQNDRKSCIGLSKSVTRNPQPIGF